MKPQMATCSECDRKRAYILIHVCIPEPEEDEGLPHEKILDILICRECVTKMGTMGMWISQEVRRHYARQR